MFISDLFENDSIEALPKGYGSEEDDQSILKLSDMRKTRLTLSQLNKLRILNDIRKLEHEQDIKKVSTQYKPAATDEGGGGMM
jgi:hypothetical protein